MYIIVYIYTCTIRSECILKRAPHPHEPPAQKDVLQLALLPEGDPVCDDWWNDALRVATHPALSQQSNILNIL